MKIIKKTFCFFLVSLLLVLSGCRTSPPNKGSVQSAKSIENQQIKTESTDAATVSTTPEDKTLISREINYFDGEGYLKILVKNPRIVRTTGNLDTSGFSSEESYVSVYSENPTDPITEYLYPSFVMENGDFISPVSLVIADVTITSFDATNGGRYENPYIFNASIVGSLIDPDGNIWNPESTSLRYEVDYYSEMHSCEENFLAFSLEPGDTISFQVGWLIGNNVDGTPIDFSDFQLGDDRSSSPIMILEE